MKVINQIFRREVGDTDVTVVVSCIDRTTLERNVLRPSCAFSERSHNKVSHAIVIFFGGIDLRRYDITVIHRYAHSRQNTNDRNYD